jgi:addiction module RelE/StbE family toxin
MVRGRKIIWDKNALKYFKDAIEFIRKDSPQNAQKIKQEIKGSVLALLDHPEKHAKDKYRINNNGSFRAYELHRYRITYFVSDSEIRIVRIRHSSQEPLTF